MKIRFLLIGTSLSLIPQTINAQCVATQDCATLGYTETSCSGGSGVKCPFGNSWACFKSDSEVCQQYGFTLSCTGSNQTGVGKACNGKYSECTCAAGYTWNNSSQKCEYDYKTNCVIGALYYSDGTCSDKVESSKTLLGIVIYEKSTSENGWIMAYQPIMNIKWSTEYSDISKLTNYSSVPNDIQASCTNTDIITTYGNSSKYPAAWTAKNYNPTGTPNSKSWCLPSGGLLNVSINNDFYLTKINTAITNIQNILGSNSATTIGTISGEWEFIWSSSEQTKEGAWIISAGNNSTIMTGEHKDSRRGNTTSVRPVLAF